MCNKGTVVFNFGEAAEVDKVVAVAVQYVTFYQCLTLSDGWGRHTEEILSR